MQKHIHIIITITILSFLVTISAYGQSSIRGQVNDQSSGEGLIGAVIEIEQLKQKVVTDLDGNFIIKGVPAGVYDLRCSYIGFKTARLIGVIVKEDGVKLAYFSMEEGAELDIVPIVTADAARHMEAALLAQRKKSSSILESISSEEIFKLGDRNAKQAVKRLAGISVESNKILYVRGVGGRYVRIMIDGYEIAQSDLYYGSLDLSIFPAEMIDNVTLYKSYNSEILGSFAGGALEINTRVASEKFTIGVDLGIGYHSLTSFKNSFLTHRDFANYFPGSSDNFLLETLLSQDLLPKTPIMPIDAAQTNTFVNNTTTFLQNQNHQTITQSAIPDFDITFFTSNTITNKKGKSFGYNIILNYQNQHRNYTNGQVGRFSLNEGQQSTLTTHLSGSDHRSDLDLSWSNIINMEWKFSKYSKIIATVSSNITSKQTTQNILGTYQIAPNQFLNYDARLRNYDIINSPRSTIQGKHAFGSEQQHKLRWVVGATFASGEQPNLLAYASFSDPDSANLSIGEHFFLRSENIPGHYQRKISEFSIPVDMHWKIRTINKSNFKMHTLLSLDYALKTQEFRELRYFYTSHTMGYSGNIEDFVTTNNLIGWDSLTNSVTPTGIFLYDASLTNNNFSGNMHVGSGHLGFNFDWNKKTNVQIGGRYEYTYGNVYNGDSTLQIENNYGFFLPSLAINYRPSDKQVFRFSYSKTFARPTFREQAPFESFNFIGDYTIIGNHALLPTLLRNLDIRWEIFPDLKEIFAVGAFYKHLDDPIQRIASEDNPNEVLTFENAAYANIVGIEIEAKKRLSFLGSFGEDLYWGINAAYIYSAAPISFKEITAIRANIPDAADYRPLFGQSPYTLNTNLSYQNSESGTVFGLSFYVSGPRILHIMRNGTPDIYEKPQPTLNLAFTQKFAKYWRFKLNAYNLLDAKVRQVQKWQGQEYTYLEYPLGQTIHVGLSFTFK